MFNVLEDNERCLLLVNSQHMRAVPGKKTYARDSEWLADLLRNGLLRASFIPPAPSRAVREMTRYRKTLVQRRADRANRLQKTLEGANLKFAAVAADVLAQVHVRCSPASGTRTCLRILTVAACEPSFLNYAER